MAPGDTAQRVQSRLNVTDEAWRALGARLREIRKEAGLTGRDLGNLNAWHGSKISKIEYSHRMPSVADIRAWCTACGVPDEAVDLIASLRAVEGSFQEWRRLERGGLRRINESVQGLWENNTSFRIYSPSMIPSPLQTGDYVRALLSSLMVRRTLVDDVETTVKVRVERQRVLDDKTKTFAVLLEESTLLHRIGGLEVMAGALGHLLSVATLSNVSLGIIPSTAPRDLVWPLELFFMYGHDLVATELVHSYVQVTRPHEVEMYTKVFNDLSSLAVYGAPARRLITSALEALES